MQFQSRLGTATASQIARVQVSLDEGASWADVYTQPGGAAETSFTLRSASLAAFAGRTLRLRLAYDFTTGTYYPQSSSGVGWYIDNLTVTNSPAVLLSTMAAANTNRTFAFSPTNAGSYLLEVRPLLFTDYPGEWGPSLAVDAVANTNVTIHISRIARASGSTWNIDFELLSGAPAGFELWSATNITAAFSREAAATIQPVLAGSKYRAIITSTATNRFFRVKPL